ncbi:VanZ family protein [Streptomyces sp. NPDC014623]|uniref:VanZ family protein n=1 Tax=Streptomyces sp. NPDC014623 TaxID=3364875 RepID=UPI0036F6EEA3
MTAEANGSARRRRVGRLLLRAAVLTAAFLALVAFSVALAKVTLTPSPASEDIVTSNLKPGRSLQQYAQDYTFLAACKQAGGNLLLGAPFGVLLPILVPRRRRMVRMMVLTASVMAVVELAQGALVAGRAFDIDDVILNTAGALLGYALVGRRISHRYHTLSGAPAAENEAERDTEPRFGRKAKAGTEGEAAVMSKTGIRAKRESGPGAGSAARRSASAPVARGRALFDRWRSRRAGPGGEAPGARRRGA